MNGARSCVIRTFDADQGIRPRFTDPHATSFDTAYRRLLASVYEASADGLDTRRTCPRCGGQVRPSVVDHDDVPPDLKMQCTRCRFIDCWGWSAASCGSHPLVLDWLWQQERTRMPTQEFVTTIDNRSATLMRYESLTSASSITAWRDLGTMKFVLIERDGITLDPATMP
jgi:ribosomal protein S27AE